MIAAALKLFDMLPGWIWAIICAGLMVTACGEREVAQHQRVIAAKARQDLADEKTDHALKLAAATDKTLRTERELTAAKGRIEEMGREREKASVEFGRRLAAAAARNGGQLRDPNARGCPAGGPASATAPAAGQGAGDTAEAGGLLSAPLTRLLQRITGEADILNDAYAECRADALSVRSITQLSPLPLSDGPAKPVAP